MTIDPKQGERDYYARLGEAGMAHAAGKPFSDDCCPQYLAAMTAIFGLLDPPPRRIVEFGCGTGWLSLFLAERGYRVIGVDISPDAVRHANAARDSRGLAAAEFVAGDYESYAADGSFDYAIFHDSLHHAESEEAALRCAYAALAKNGAVIALEPGSGHSAAASSQRAVQDFGVHERDMPPGRIIAVARRAGFQRHSILPHPYQLNRRFYRRAYHRARSQSDLTGYRLLSMLRAFGQVCRWRNDPALVMLWK